MQGQGGDSGLLSGILRGMGTKSVRGQSDMWSDECARTALRRIFDAAVKSADPAAAVRRHLPEKPRGRCVVVGAGKGAAVMAAAVDARFVRTVCSVRG